MAAAGCNIPEAIGNWDGKKLTMVPNGFSRHPMKVMCKIPDSSLGIGDKIIENIEFDVAGIKKLTEILQTDFDGKECIIMKFILPTPKYGVH